MSNLTDFLLARIAEDEGELSLPSEWNRRAYAECEAKRRIVEKHALRVWPREGRFPGARLCSTCGEVVEPIREDRAGLQETVQFPCATLCYLATPYADHPDYREEWKP